MILTYLETGDSILENLAAGRKRLWEWAELEPEFPYYLLDFVVRTEDGTLTRQVITDVLEEVLVVVQTHRQDINLRYVYLISPGHLNGSGTVQMKPLLEIWAIEKEHYAEALFVHDDGSTVRFSWMQDQEKDVIGTKRLVVDLRRLRNVGEQGSRQ